MSTISKNEEMRQRLIEAAGQVFAEVGYEAATIRQITDKAGVNVAAINYYFRDKLQLYRTVLRTITQKAFLTLKRNCAEGAPEERLRKFVQSIVTDKSRAEYPWASVLMAREITELHEAQADFIVEAVKPLHMVAEQIIAEVVPGATSGQVKLAAGFTITLCVNHAQQQRLEQRMFPKFRFPRGGIETTIEPVYRFALAGIRALCRSVP